MKMTLCRCIKAFEILNGFYLPVSDKMRFDAALVKFLIRLDQLWRNKESKIP